MSNSVQPHRQQSTRLPAPWDSPGKNTGVGCHFLLQCMKSEKWKWSHSRQEYWSGLSFPPPMHEKWKVKVKSLSPIWLVMTPWTAAYQAPPSMGFSRQEYWSGVPLPSLYKVYKCPYFYVYIQAIVEVDIVTGNRKNDQHHQPHEVIEWGFDSFSAHPLVVQEDNVFQENKRAIYTKENWLHRLNP